MIIYTVITPASINVTVAVIDRTESLPIPHTACPLVHPFASDTQNHTRIPAIMYSIYDDDTSSILDSGKIIL